MLITKGLLLPTRKHCVPQRGFDNFESVLPERCPGPFIIAVAKKKAFLSAWPGFLRWVFYTAVELRTWAKVFQMECVTVPGIFVVLDHGGLHLTGAGLHWNFHFHYHVYLIPYHILSEHATSFAYGASFSYSPVLNIQTMMMMMKMTITIMML